MRDFYSLFISDYMQRVDLIQDLRFETATAKIKATPDGEFLIAAGAFKVYFLSCLVCSFIFTIKGEFCTECVFVCMFAK